MTKPLSEFTPSDLADELRRLAPAADVAVDGTIVTARIPGIDVYLRAKGEATYGPGLVWNMDAMGPSDWGDDEPDEVVQQFLSTDDPANVGRIVAWLAEYGWSQHRAAEAMA